MTSDKLQRHIVTRVTDEGLLVEVFDLDHAPLFHAGTNTPTPLLEAIIATISVDARTRHQSQRSTYTGPTPDRNARKNVKRSLIDSACQARRPPSARMNTLATRPAST